ncbi:hypothetical protein P3X46_011475 [Hevea brasiliensis]|uniref:glycerophosphodiester phosphodiesterase n=1 Tax=Hevea brasiliensis TaxID=3981 RepID=A0ABQ9M9C0_HEVBR|nr:hypothetical protein P3X46_011475 [Hevea brasiliensis]
MALKAVHVSDVPNLDQVPENAACSLCTTRFTNKSVNDHEGDHDGTEQLPFKFPKFVVMGHRGSGMNMPQCSDIRMKSIKENSILSFNAAAKLPVDFIEFDVQVTKDDCPVIFHDNFILTEDQVAKPLFRKTKDGRIFEWKVEEDDPLCTLQEVFQKVDGSIGFNIELKFDDQTIYKQEEFAHILQVILKVVFEHAKDRPIMFSSFQPDAAQLMRKLQRKYPVFFLTNGGSEIYTDIRRNSLDEAIKVCMEGGLQGIVSEVKAIFRNPEAVTRVKESKLSLISYGLLNCAFRSNVPEVVCVQHLMGVEGVIVDLVREITEAVPHFTDPAKVGEELRLFGKEGKMKFEALIPAELSIDNLICPVTL